MTYTWSRNPSMDTRRADETAWTTHARRIQPGQEIVINRDEDPAEGDLGLRMREKTTDSVTGEKVSDESGGGSSLRITGPDEGLAVRTTSSDESDNERSSLEERELAEGQAVIDDGEGGRKTPPLAQYREGNHLIVERKRNEGEEVSLYSAVLARKVRLKQR